MKYWVLLLLLGIGVFSCTEKISLTENDQGQAYFPVKAGNYWVYEVVETQVINNQSDSVTYQVKELIDSVFTNQVNEPTYRILKSRRSDTTQPWGNDSLYTVNVYQTNVQVTRNNKRVVSLVFPVTEGKSWNANAFNNAGEAEYFYEDVNQPFLNAGTSYGKTIKIIQGQPNEVVLDDRYEIYASGIGLVFKKFQVYDYVQSNGEVNKTKIASGTKRVFTLTEFYTPE